MNEVLGSQSDGTPQRRDRKGGAHTTMTAILSISEMCEMTMFLVSMGTANSPDKG